jgi:hypothetical protein
VPPELHVSPLVDIIPAAGLEWLVDARPADLWANRVTHHVATTLVPTARFDAFAAGHGGVDLRQAREFVAAGFEASSLALVSTPIVPERLEAAFASRALTVEGRSVDHGVTRVWGKRGDEAAGEQLAIFGEQAVGWERGRSGILRVAALFAEGRLRRALAALKAEPLASAATEIGDGPIRVFAPGPFEGEFAGGLGGLLRATTAVAATIRPRAQAELLCHIALMGAWGQDAPAAADRLSAVFETLALDPIGRLMGIDRPLSGPHSWSQGGTIRLEVSLDANAVARGLHAATGATVEEMMAY